MTAPLNAFLSMIHALEWLDLRSKADKVVVAAFFDGQFGDPVQIALGSAEPALGRPEAARFVEILTETKGLIAEQHFLNWQVAFPGVWSNWEGAELTGGFDAVVGNPPWDRLKLQEVEWWAARKPEIARAETAAKRKQLIKALEKVGDPLFNDFERAAAIAETASRVSRKSVDYPLLSGGDTNLNSLFIERAHALIKPGGIVGLLVPSGIASDQSSAGFFRKMTEERRLASIVDFFNKRTDGTLFFPDVYYRFKFCAYVAGGADRHFDKISFGFFIRDLAELRDPERLFPVAPEDIARINPNSRTAPIFQSRHDLELTKVIYDDRPVLVDRSTDPAINSWPVRYVRMLDMANDSSLFLGPTELKRIGAYPISQNVWKKGGTEYLPLYEGKMVQAFDHRASDILLADGNLFRTGQGRDLTLEEHQNPARVPVPRYWVESDKINWSAPTNWCLAIKDITSVTNARTMIAMAIPHVGAGHTLPVIFPALEDMMASGTPAYSDFAVLLLANFNSVILDYLARQKVHGNHLAWYLIEQLPILKTVSYSKHFGPKTANTIVRDAVLELTYTSHDMAPFAIDLGHVDQEGNVLPPFRWDDERRLRLRAKLDAVYFHLYGVTNRDDVLHIFSTFPIVEREDIDQFGTYRTRELCLAYMSALAAGDPDAQISL